MRYQHENVSKEKCPKCKKGYLVYCDGGMTWCSNELTCDYGNKGKL